MAYRLPGLPAYRLSPRLTGLPAPRLAIRFRSHGFGPSGMPSFALTEQMVPEVMTVRTAAGALSRPSPFIELRAAIAASFFMCETFTMPRRPSKTVRLNWTGPPGATRPASDIAREMSSRPGLCRASTVKPM